MQVRPLEWRLPSLANWAVVVGRSHARSAALKKFESSAFKGRACDLTADKSDT